MRKLTHVSTLGLNHRMIFIKRVHMRVGFRANNVMNIMGSFNIGPAVARPTVPAPAPLLKCPQYSPAWDTPQYLRKSRNPVGISGASASNSWQWARQKALSCSGAEVHTSGKFRTGISATQFSGDISAHKSDHYHCYRYNITRKCNIAPSWSSITCGCGDSTC